jgi:tRNA (guanine-N7-)-methyltransferase
MIVFPWRQYNFPIDWQNEFASDAPLHLEVGFGDGRFTLRRALENPQDSFVALEISTVSISRLMHKLKKANVHNVRILKLGAQFALKHLFGTHSLTSITVNFPDPWPKEKHIQNRLLQNSFYQVAANRLEVGGTICLATDHPEYLDFARAEAMTSGVFRLEDATPPGAVFETKYALKWKGQGKPLFYQVFVNLGQEYPSSGIERSTMPHALLLGELPKDVNFTKQVLPFADGHVIVHEVLNSLGDEHMQGQRWLFRVTVDEPELKQQLLIVTNKREGDEYIVRFEPFGDPVLTKTARGAVHAVTEWLLTLPSMRLKARNY